jgi:hypothetical protein
MGRRPRGILPPRKNEAREDERKALLFVEVQAAEAIVFGP